MSKLKIAVDLDGVVWDIMGVFIDIYNSLFKKNVKWEDVDDWYYFPKEQFDIVYPLTLPRIMEYPILDKNIPTHLYFLNKIHDVSILTKEQNPIGTLEAKLETLDIYKGREYNTLIKADLNYPKVNYVFDIFIDDYPGMGKEIQEFPKKVLLYYTQPWNKRTTYKGINNVLRVEGWDEIMSFIRKAEIIISGEWNDTLFR